MFACEHFDIEPDMMVVGKGLTSGYAHYRNIGQ